MSDQTVITAAEQVPGPRDTGVPDKPSSRATSVIAIVVTLVMLVGGAWLSYEKYKAVVPSPKPTPAVKTISAESIFQPVLTPSKNEVEGLSLPKPMEIDASRPYVLITAACTNEVRWLVMGKVADAPVQALYIPLTNSVMIFPSGNHDDMITVIAYSYLSDKPTEMAATFIKVNVVNPEPSPEPKPDPVTPPTSTTTPTNLHITFLLDRTKQNRATADIINSKDLRDWAAANGHEIHELSIKDDLKSLGLDIADIVNTPPPVLIFQWKLPPVDKTGKKLDGKFIKAMPLLSVQQVKDETAKTIGGK